MDVGGHDEIGPEVAFSDEEEMDQAMMDIDMEHLETTSVALAEEDVRRARTALQKNNVFNVRDESIPARSTRLRRTTLTEYFDLGRREKEVVDLRRRATVGAGACGRSTRSPAKRCA